MNGLSNADSDDLLKINGTRETVPWNTDYVTKSKGYLVVGGYTSGQVARVNIDGVGIESVTPVSSNYNTEVGLLVGRGRTIKITGSSEAYFNTRLFYPIT